jgi:competence protein ComEA
MDHRVGTALSAVAITSGITMGGYALWTAQPQAQPQPFAVAQTMHRTAAEGGDRYGDSDESGADRGGGADSDSGSYFTPGPGTLGGIGSSQGGLLPMAPVPNPSPSSAIMVDVEGKVAHPGVQRLPVGARVLDAITMAGGALPGTDLSSLDQARVLNDGEQIMVGPGAGAGAGAGAGPGPTVPAAKGRSKAALTQPVPLNSATLEQLEQLPGVGPALAQRVLDWRAQHGRFTSVDELQVVKGFGPRKFAAVRSLVTL